jgi:hypothetical protein
MKKLLEIISTDGEENILQTMELKTNIMTLEEKGFTVTKTVTSARGTFEQLIRMISARKCRIMYRRTTNGKQFIYASERFTDHHLFTERSGK